MIAARDEYALFEEARQQGPNPFKKDTVIAAEEVWGEIISDLTSFNQHIDQKINQAILDIRQKYLGKVGIVVKGDKGTGKSHSIRRIWKKIEREGGALFSYISPCSNPKTIDAHVRFHLSESLSHQDAYGVSQWQKLAATMISTLSGTDFEEEYKQYLEKCSQPDELRKHIRKVIPKEELLTFFSGLAEAILENQTGLDFYFCKAVLLSLLKNAPLSQIALSWIKGEDNLEIKGAGLPEYSSEQQEARNIWVIKQICKMAEVASWPVIIWFDQAESSMPDIDRGDSAAETVARCIDRIYFDCTNVVLLCCLPSDTWVQVQKMQGGIPDRVGQWVLDAKPPTAEQMIELIQMRLNWFYQLKGINRTALCPLYPMEELQIRKIAQVGAGVRLLLDKCSEMFDKKEAPGHEDEEEKGHEKQKQMLLDKYDELLKKITVPSKDDEKLAAVITCGMNMVPKGGTAGVVITKVGRINNNSNHDLHLIIDGYDSIQNKEVRIGVRVCETSNGISFNAVMKRLLDYKKYKLTRGCLVRYTLVPMNWKKGKELEQELLKEAGGEVVVLNRGDLKPGLKSLVALERMYEQSTDYGFNKNELVALVQEIGLVTSNSLICEILSAPQ